MIRQSSGDDTDFAPFGDDYRGFDPRDADTNGRGALILALAVGVLLIFAAVVWNTYRQGVRAEGDTPFITADAGSYKRTPDETTAPMVPDTDRQIYDQMDGSDRTEDEEATTAAFLKGGPPASLRKGLDPDTEPEEAQPAPRTYAQAESTVRETPLPAPRAPVETAIVEPAVPLETGPAPAADTPPPPTASTTVTQSVVSPWGIEPSGAYLVQIGAFRSEVAADQAWIKLTTDGAGLLDQAAKRIQRADLGARGVFFRLRAGAFGTRENAGRFCDALKERDIACMVVSG